MRQLLILSGKGGTGKTTIAGAFIRLSAARAYADCDVDAPNLHLIIGHTEAPCRSDFYGMPKAKIDINCCLGCGQCEAHCSFDAISNKDGYYMVDNLACEGCGVCHAICPNNAISMIDFVSGELFLYKNNAVFSTAKLKAGGGNSGKLVTEVKKQMQKTASDVPFAIVDGSPGIGCPVIASLSGTDAVLIVTEPSVSGVSDMQRIITTAAYFGVKIAVCVNKYDVNLQITKDIEQFCFRKNLYFAGKIPYDQAIVTANNAGVSVVDTDCPSGGAIIAVYNNLKDKFLK